MKKTCPGVLPGDLGIRRWPWIAGERRSSLRGVPCSRSYIFPPPPLSSLYGSSSLSVHEVRISTYGEGNTVFILVFPLLSVVATPPLHSHCMLFRSFDGAAITRTHLYMEETGSIWHNPINRLPFFSVHRFSTLFFLMLLTPFVYFLSYIYVYFYFIDFIRGIFLISSSPLRSSGGLRLRNEWWDVEKSWMLKKFGRLAAPLFPRVFFWSGMTAAWTISLSPFILVRFSGVFWYGFLEFVTGFGESRK